MTQVLTLKTVKRKAREAYKDRRLTAQHRNKSGRVCRYRIGFYRCAIGASMSEATLDLLGEFKTSIECTANEMALDYIREKELVTIEIEDEPGIAAIQKAHDEWAALARRKRVSPKSRATIKARNHFLKLIAA